MIIKIICIQKLQKTKLYSLLVNNKLLNKTNSFIKNIFL